MESLINVKEGQLHECIETKPFCTQLTVSVTGVSQTEQILMKIKNNLISGDLLLHTESINEIVEFSDDCDGNVICYHSTLGDGDGRCSELKIGKNPIHHQYCQYYLNYLSTKNEKINLDLTGCWTGILY